MIPAAVVLSAVNRPILSSAVSVPVNENALTSV